MMTPSPEATNATCDGLTVAELRETIFEARWRSAGRAMSSILSPSSPPRKGGYTPAKVDRASVESCVREPQG